MTPMNEIDQVLSRLWLNKERVKWMVCSQEGLPPLEDMLPDIDRLIVSIIRPYVDPSNPMLHFEDLVSECKEKLAKLLVDGLEQKAPTRAKFFAYIKTAFRNHVFSLVQKHVFAFKRTGAKPPPRKQQMQQLADAAKHAEAEDEPLDSEKSVKLYLDDPDANVQVGEPFDETSVHEREVTEELKHYLTAIERLVLDQMLSPNEEAMVYAQVEAYRGKKPESVNFRVNYRHMAEGLGMSFDLFQQAMASIKQKYKVLMSNEDKAETHEQQKVRLAELTLAQVFGVQVPPTIDAVTKRRLFTLIARDQIDKVTTDVANLLTAIGAHVPHKLGDQLSCHGVLWQRNHRICVSCGVQDSCKVKAVNLGLGDMVLSPKLLGAKLTRIPVILPNQSQEENVEPERGVIPQTNRDEEVLAYLNEGFKAIMHMGEVYYRPDMEQGRSLFCVGEPGQPMKLRFCNPSEDLRASLKLGGKRGWYVPDNLTAKEVIEIIDQHAASVLT